MNINTGKHITIATEIQAVLNEVDLFTDEDAAVQRVADAFHNAYSGDISDQINLSKYLIENEDSLPTLIERILLTNPSQLFIGCLCGWFFNWILGPELELHRYVYYHLPTLLYLFMLNHKENPEYLSGIDVLLLSIYNYIRKSITADQNKIKIPDLSQPTIYQINELKEESDEMGEKDTRISELSNLKEISDVNYNNINIVFTITLYYLKREIFILPNSAICKLCGLFLVLTNQPFISKSNLNNDLSIIPEDDDDEEEEINMRRERSASIAIPLEPFPYQLTVPVKTSQEHLNSNNNNNTSETKTLSPPYLTSQTIVECSNILDHIFFIFHNDAIKNMCYNSLLALHRYCIINNIFDALLSVSSTMIFFNKYFKKRMLNFDDNTTSTNTSSDNLSSQQVQQQQQQQQQQVQQQPPPPM